MKATILSLTICLALAGAHAAIAQEKVFLIRHGEKQSSGEDPGLTDAGRQRAESWATLLGRSGLDIVISTDARRTRETGDIIASSLDLERIEVATMDVLGLMDLLSFDHSDKTVLVVAHAETIPSILSHLGAPNELEISQEDFANLFIVLPDDANEAAMVHLRMP